MNLRMLLRIAGLRYRLLWANVRSKRGKAVLFVCAYLLVVPIAILLLAGGIGAGLVAIRTGRGELVAGIVLGVVYLDATLIAVALGTGSSPAFSDAVLRRYPLSRLDRLGARQLTAFLEPVWLFVLALDLGVAVGFHAFLGASSLWLAVPAAILLLVTNFLLARSLSVLTGWIASRRVGAMLLVIAILVLVPAVSALGRSAASGKHAILHSLLPLLQLSPPFAAAGIIAGSSALVSLYRLLGLLFWCLIFAALLVLAERLPAASRRVGGVRTAWTGPCDRVAALFGPSAPLVSKTLRYYLRSNRARIQFATVLIIFLLSFPLSALGNPHHGANPAKLIFLALGTLPVVGWAGTTSIGANAFGFDGAGFRRYLLAPVTPSSVLRVASLVPLCLSALLIPVGLLAYGMDVPMNGVILAMFVSSALWGLFFFHGLAIWTSLLAPGKVDVAAAYEKDTSAGAKVVGFAVLVLLFLSMALLDRLSVTTLLHYWWVLPVMMVAAACFYFASLLVGARVFSARRERLLSMVERGY
ncbi:MAG: hypothetical protein P8Z30_06145 [Acidobacteriota bacterium]